MADFATLAETLLKLENKEFGRPATGDAATWRDQLIDAVGRFRLQREEMGLLIADGRKHFKKERVWLRVVKAVAETLGYKSRRSIETLIDDAERANTLHKLSAYRYDALERCGVIAAETQWRLLIEALSADIPRNETGAEAQSKVEKLYNTFSRPKNTAETPSEQTIERTIKNLNEKIEGLLANLFSKLPRDQHDAAVHQIIDRATKKASELAMQKAAAKASQQAQHPANIRPVLVVPQKVKEQSKAAIAKPSSPVRQVALLGPNQPWGDAFLGSLIPGATDRDPLEYRENALHRASRDKQSKRFFAGDPFAVGLSDYIVDRHLRFFQVADWHTFMVLTQRIDRALGIKKQTTGLRLPDNLWMGVTITSSDAFDQIEALGRLEAPNKWVSFLPFTSGKPLRELSPTLEEILRRAGIRWVVFGGDLVNGWRISQTDEEEIVRASHAAGCPVYCTSTQTRDDLIRYETVDPGSVPGVFFNRTKPRDIWKFREFPEFIRPSIGLSA